jgi:hypothetical protein
LLGRKKYPEPITEVRSVLSNNLLRRAGVIQGEISERDVVCAGSSSIFKIQIVIVVG